MRKERSDPLVPPYGAEILDQNETMQTEPTRFFFPLDVLPEGARLSKVMAEPARCRGKNALRVELTPESVAAKDHNDSNTLVIIPFEFGDGVIEVDLLGKLLPTAPPEARGFVGLAFRVSSDASKFEAIYLRPTNGRTEDPVRRERAVQYFAYPEWKFDRLRRETPGRYEAGANIGPDEWLHLRLLVRGAQATAYLGAGDDAPLLTVAELKLGPSARGSLALFVDIGTEGYFANLKVSPELD